MSGSNLKPFFFIMGKSFSESLRDMLVSFARIMGREVKEGQVDLKLDYRWYIVIGLFVLCVAGIVWSLVSIKKPILILAVVVLGLFGLVALVRSHNSGSGS